MRPEVLLLDEPLGALDLNLRRQMQDELVGLQRRLGTTFVHVTHDQDEGMSIADKVVVLNNGRIEDCGSPDRVYLNPATLFTATFMGESNIVAGRVTDASGGSVRLATPLGDITADGAESEGCDIHVSIRPEHILLEAGEDTESLGRAVLTDSVSPGERTHRCRARTTGRENVELLIYVPVERAVAVGDEVDVHARRHRIVLLTD